MVFSLALELQFQNQFVNLSLFREFLSIGKIVEKWSYFFYTKSIFPGFFIKRIDWNTVIVISIKKLNEKTLSLARIC